MQGRGTVFFATQVSAFHSRIVFCYSGTMAVVVSGFLKNNDRRGSATLDLNMCRLHRKLHHAYTYSPPLVAQAFFDAGC
jgi:hypothetical protein